MDGWRDLHLQHLAALGKGRTFVYTYRIPHGVMSRDEITTIALIQRNDDYREDSSLFMAVTSPI